MALQLFNTDEGWATDKNGNVVELYDNKDGQPVFQQDKAKLAGVLTEVGHNTGALANDGQYWIGKSKPGDDINNPSLFGWNKDNQELNKFYNELGQPNKDAFDFGFDNKGNLTIKAPQDYLDSDEFKSFQKKYKEDFANGDITQDSYNKILSNVQDNVDEYMKKRMEDSIQLQQFNANYDTQYKYDEYKQTKNSALTKPIDEITDDDEAMFYDSKLKKWRPYKGQELRDLRADLTSSSKNDGWDGLDDVKIEHFGDYIQKAKDDKNIKDYINNVQFFYSLNHDKLKEQNALLKASPLMSGTTNLLNLSKGFNSGGIIPWMKIAADLAGNKSLSEFYGGKDFSHMTGMDYLYGEEGGHPDSLYTVGKGLSTLAGGIGINVAEAIATGGAGKLAQSGKLGATAGKVANFTTKFEKGLNAIKNPALKFGANTAYFTGKTIGKDMAEEIVKSNVNNTISGYKNSFYSSSVGEYIDDTKKALSADWSNPLNAFGKLSTVALLGSGLAKGIGDTKLYQNINASTAGLIARASQKIDKYTPTSVIKNKYRGDFRDSIQKLATAERAKGGIENVQNSKALEMVGRNLTRTSENKLDAIMVKDGSIGKYMDNENELAKLHKTIFGDEKQLVESHDGTKKITILGSKEQNAKYQANRKYQIAKDEFEYYKEKASSNNSPEVEKGLARAEEKVQKQYDDLVEKYGGVDEDMLRYNRLISENGQLLHDAQYKLGVNDPEVYKSASESGRFKNYSTQAYFDKNIGDFKGDITPKDITEKGFEKGYKGGKAEDDYDLVELDPLSSLQKLREQTIDRINQSIIKSVSNSIADLSTTGVFTLDKGLTHIAEGWDYYKDINPKAKIKHDKERAKFEAKQKVMERGFYSQDNTQKFRREIGKIFQENKSIENGLDGTEVITASTKVYDDYINDLVNNHGYSVEKAIMTATEDSTLKQFARDNIIRSYYENKFGEQDFNRKALNELDKKLAESRYSDEISNQTQLEINELNAKMEQAINNQDTKYEVYLEQRDKLQNELNLNRAKNIVETNYFDRAIPEKVMENNGKAIAEQWQKYNKADTILEYSQQWQKEYEADIELERETFSNITEMFNAYAKNNKGKQTDINKLFESSDYIEAGVKNPAYTALAQSYYGTDKVLSQVFKSGGKKNLLTNIFTKDGDLKPVYAKNPQLLAKTINEIKQAGDKLLDEVKRLSGEEAKTVFTDLKKQRGEAKTMLQKHIRETVNHKGELTGNHKKLVEEYKSLQANRQLLEKRLNDNIDFGSDEYQESIATLDKIYEKESQVANKLVLAQADYADNLQKLKDDIQFGGIDEADKKVLDDQLEDTAKTTRLFYQQMTPEQAKQHFNIKQEYKKIDNVDDPIIYYDGLENRRIEREEKADLKLMTDNPIFKQLLNAYGDSVKKAENIGFYSRVAGGLSQLFRAGTTGLNPLAWTRNAWRDTFHSGTTAGTFGMLGKVWNDNLESNISKLAKKYNLTTDEIDSIRVSAKMANEMVMGTTSFDVNGRNGDKAIEIYRNRGKNKAQLLGTKLYEKGTFVGEKVEVGTRKANTEEAFMRAIDRAMARGEAFSEALNDGITEGLYMGRTATTDFAIRANPIRQLSRGASYLNSGFAGSSSFVSLWTHDPVGMTNRIMAFTATPLILLHSHNTQDKDLRDAYANIPDYVKDSNLIFLVKNKNGKVSSITTPLPQELSGIAGYINNLFATGDPADINGLLNLSNVFSPIDLSGFAEKTKSGEWKLHNSVKRGLEKLSSQFLPDAVKMSYSAITGRDLFTGGETYKRTSKAMEQAMGLKDADDKESKDNFISRAIYSGLHSVLGGNTDSILNLVDTLNGIREDDRAGFSFFDGFKRTYNRDIGQEGEKGKRYDYINQVFNDKITALDEEKKEVLRKVNNLDKDIRKETDEAKKAKLQEERDDITKRFAQDVQTSLGRWLTLYQTNNFAKYGYDQEKQVMRLLDFSGYNDSNQIDKNDKALEDLQQDARALNREDVMNKYLSLGLDARPSNDFVYDYNKQTIKGAPARAAKEAEIVAKLKVKGDQTLSQVRKEYRERIRDIEANKSLSSKQRTALTSELSKEYNEKYWLPAILPLVEKYTTRGLVNNPSVMDALEDTTLTPKDMIVDSRGRKMPYSQGSELYKAYTKKLITELFKPYEKDLTIQGIKSDNTVANAIKRMEALKASGDISGAMALSNLTRRSINDGRIMATKEDMEKLYL